MSNIANLFSHIMTLIGLNHYNKTESDNRYAEKSHSHSNYLTSQSITGKEDTSNKVTSWSSTTTDAHYPSEKLVKSALDDKLNTTTAASTYQPKGNYATTADLYQHLQYIELTSSMVTTANGTKTVTYSDGNEESDINDIVLIYNHTGSDLDVTTSYSLNSNTVSYISVYSSKNLLFKNGETIIAIKSDDSLYEGFPLTDKYVTSLINGVAYNNIKSGESTSLTLTNQKLINDAINTKFGNMDTVSVVVTYTDNTTETLNLFKYTGN